MAKYIANSANGYYQLELEVNQTSQNVANNTSTLSWYLRLRSIAQASFSLWDVTQKATINGTDVLSQTTQPAVGQYVTVLLGSGSHVVTHEADGTKTVAVSASIDTVYQSYLPDYIAVSGSLALTTIPRATTPTASTGTLGSSHTISLPRASSLFTHDVTYTFGSASGTIATGAGVSASWTPPLSLANQIPKATSGNMVITVVTKNGATVIGTRSINVPMNVPSSVVPTVSSATFSEAVAGMHTQFQGFVRYKSKIKADITASGAYGSTIKSITFRVDNQPVTASNLTASPSTVSLTIPNFIQSPANTYLEGIHVTVVDSRNRSTLVKYPYTVLDWYPPKITRLDAIRTNPSGVATDDGWNARIYYSFDIANVNSKNTKSWKIERWTGSAWELVSSGSVYTATNQNVLSGAVFNPDTTHQIRLTVTDYFGSSTATFSLPTSSNVLDFKANKKGMAIGKAAENDGLEVAWNANFLGALKVNNIPVVPKPSLVFASTGTLIPYTSDYLQAVACECNASLQGLHLIVQIGSAASDTRGDQKFFLQPSGSVGVLKITVQTGEARIGYYVSGTKVMFYRPDNVAIYVRKIWNANAMFV